MVHTNFHINRYSFGLICPKYWTTYGWYRPGSCLQSQNLNTAGSCVQSYVVLLTAFGWTDYIDALLVFYYICYYVFSIWILNSSQHSLRDVPNSFFCLFQLYISFCYICNDSNVDVFEVKSKGIYSLILTLTSSISVSVTKLPFVPSIHLTYLIFHN